MIWIVLKENSKLVLPNLTQLVKMKEEKVDGKVVLDCKALQTKLKEIRRWSKGLKSHITKKVF